MPREIIDTQSSRPRYVRRMAFTVAVGIIVLAVVVFAIWSAFGHAVPGK
jgi:hypothetical protein